MKEMINQLIDFCLNRPIEGSMPHKNINQIIDYMKYHRIEGVLKGYFDFIGIKNEFLDLEVKKNIRSNESYIKLANKIAGKFEEKGINYAVLKGVALCKEIYEKTYYRKYSDLDILICEKDISQVEEILNNLGFVHGIVRNGKLRKATRKEIIFKKLYTHELFNFVKVDGEFVFNIDINFKFSWNGISNSFENMIEIPSEEALNSTKKLKNFPANILNNEYQFLHLCCHLYNESVFSVLDTEYFRTEPEDIFLNRILDIILFSKKEKLNIDKLQKMICKYKCDYKINFAIDLITIITKIDEISSLYNPNLENRVDFWYDKAGNRLKRKRTFKDSIFALRENDGLFYYSN